MMSVFAFNVCVSVFVLFLVWFLVSSQHFFICTYTYLNFPNILINAIKVQDFVYCIVLEIMHGTLPLDGEKSNNPASHSLIRGNNYQYIQDEFCETSLLWHVIFRKNTALQVKVVRNRLKFVNNLYPCLFVCLFVCFYFNSS